MKKYLLYSLSALMGLGLTMSSPGVFAATCGSVSMTSGGGEINCVAYGPGNITLKNGDYQVNGDTTYVDPFTAPLPPYTDILAKNDGEGASGLFNFESGIFSIDADLWNLWDSVFVAIKQGNGNGGGGWGMLEVNREVVAGTYATKLQGNGSKTGISHYFAVGGEEHRDIDEIPIPAAVWLFGSGLVGLLGFSRRKSTPVLQA